MPSKSKFKDNNPKVKQKKKKHPYIRVCTFAFIGLLFILFTLYDLMLYGVNLFTYLIGGLGIILVIIAGIKMINIIFPKEKKK